MEGAQNNSQILSFINSQMKLGQANQMNNEEQAKMIETLKKFQEFMNAQQDVKKEIQNLNNNKNLLKNKDNNIRESEDDFEKNEIFNNLEKENIDENINDNNNKENNFENNL